MKKLIILIIAIFFSVTTFAQKTKDKITAKDTAIILPTVLVNGYIHKQLLRQTPASVGVLDDNSLRLQSTVSLLPAINTIPGVRMEERSPGSYRLSIRGSLVRSPYGVRNVKIYYNDFSLTDAGGNTYLNALNSSDLERVEVLKGPDGSLFGANSGGVVFLQSSSDYFRQHKISLFTGSYGLFGDAAGLQEKENNHIFHFIQSYQRADGYRQNTKNRRLFFQGSDIWKYNSRNSLEAYVFYSDQAYRTPGGLTLQQYNENPRSARYATSKLPGAVEQKAGTYTKMFFSGVRHIARLSDYVDHTLSLWFTHVGFSNPFITNYEKRNENNVGLRTYLSFHLPESTVADLQPIADVGVEGQRLTTVITNYDNNKGVPGAVQAYSNILSKQTFEFARLRLKWKDILILEAAASYNSNGYRFKDTTRVNTNFHPEWMPHFALNFRLADPVVLRLTLSRGYSVPTTEEVRPSETVNTSLQAEEGWNSEVGLRLSLLRNRVVIDASAYHYDLHHGIVSQVDSAGNNFFLNSGRIQENGLEVVSSSLLIASSSEFIRRLQWDLSYTYAYYKYSRFVENNVDYSGNRVAGVPRTTLINNFYIGFPQNIYLSLQYNFTSQIPLNDANSTYAKAYHLVSARIGWNLVKPNNFIPEIYLSMDNILNQKYSLGNDINAVGGRYFNAAPLRNFTVGLNWKI